MFSQWDHCLVSFLIIYLFNLWQGLTMFPSGASNFWRAGAMDMYHHTTSILFLLLKELNQNQRPYSYIFSFLCDGRWFCICLKIFLFLSFRTHQAHFYTWALRNALPRNCGCTEEEKRHAAITCIRWSGCGGWGLRIKPKDSLSAEGTGWKRCWAAIVAWVGERRRQYKSLR